jgi:hypothetical protein
MALMIEVKNGGHVYIGDRDEWNPKHIGGRSHLLQFHRDGGRLQMCGGYVGNHAIYEVLNGQWRKVGEYYTFF